MFIKSVIYRWMSKALYYLKIRLLSKQFEMSSTEREEVDCLVEFCALFYMRYWFEAPLASSAARVDLDFMTAVHNYRLKKPVLAFGVLQSTYRHLWYLSSQLIVLALVDEGLERL